LTASDHVVVPGEGGAAVTVASRSMFVVPARPKGTPAAMTI
jgi:hypothetical protein